jgi:hypothetical protein
MLPLLCIRYVVQPTENVGRGHATRNLQNKAKSHFRTVRREPPAMPSAFPLPTVFCPKQISRKPRDNKETKRTQIRLGGTTRSGLTAAAMG